MRLVSVYTYQILPTRFDDHHSLSPLTGADLLTVRDRFRLLYDSFLNHANPR
jgi:hypothetical protein